MIYSFEDKTRNESKQTPVGASFRIKVAKVTSIDIKIIIVIISLIYIFIESL